MERNTAFVPPPFLGSGFRQNHQIRALKTNSYPILPSHRSLSQPSSSPTSASIALLTTRGTPLGPNFSRTNLTSHRRKHIRKCYDLLHLSIQRRQLGLAARFLKVILGAHEWTSDEGFQLALLLLALSQEEVEEGEAEAPGKIGFLQMMDLESSSSFKSTHITPALMEAYIAKGRLSDAIELLEQRVNVHPYKGRPELHCGLGMLYVFVGVQTLLNNNAGGDAEERGGGEGVELRKLDRTTKAKARLCFESAIQASESCVRGESLRRQRIWGVRKREGMVDEERLRGRERLWGCNPLEENQGEGGSWPLKEYADLAKIRRRLEGIVSEEENEEEGEGEGEGESDAESSASGSVFTVSSDEEERGRTRTRTRSHTATNEPDPSSPSQPQEEEDEETAAAAVPKHGPKAWAKAWPEISPIFTPSPPPSVMFAQQFLSLLAPNHASQSQKGSEREGDGGRGRKRKLGMSVELDSPFFTDGEDEGGVGGVDGLQLTREEAEMRLRRILFETEEDGADARMDRKGDVRDRGGNRMKREGERERDRARAGESREDRRRRKEAKRQRERREDGTDRERRKKRRDAF
ncbi:uncharacterized protein UDID_04073 [Ustilago sp. UG-2017a]|nr:uncharacterized protein UDID_04073 [Ustilago sp. UG-2017a]